MKIEYLPIECLIEYTLNNVRHSETQVDRLANSIREYGWTVPLLVSKDNVIIAGHGRLQAAKKLGLESVPVLRAEDMTPAQERQYRILDNALARQSEWDIENLKLEFDVMKDDGFDVAAWGLEALVPTIVDVPVMPQEFDESVADGVVLEASFKIKIPADDSDSFEARLDELLREFPTATKEKKL